MHFFSICIFLLSWFCTGCWVWMKKITIKECAQCRPLNNFTCIFQLLYPSYLSSSSVSDLFLLNFTLQTNIPVFWFAPSETDFDSGHSKTRERRGSSVAAALRHCLSSWSSSEYFTEPHLAPGLPPYPPPLRQGRGAITNCALLHPQIPIRPLALLPPSPSSSLPLNSRHTTSPSLFPLLQPVGFRRPSRPPS